MDNRNKITNYFSKNESDKQPDQQQQNKRKKIERTDTIVDEKQLNFLDSEKTQILSNQKSTLKGGSVDQEIEATQEMDTDSLPKKYNDSNNNNNNPLKKSKNSSTTSTTTTTAPNNDLDDFVLEERQTSTIFLIPSDSDEKYIDVWNSEYVKLPCSKNNVYKSTIETTSRQPSSASLSSSTSGVSTGDVKTVTEVKYLSKWYLINTVLSNPIKDSEALEQTIKSYNKHSRWDFQGLHDFFECELTESETKDFFSNTLPKIIKLALQLPFVCPRPIPLLRKSVDREIVLSQKQIASLMANAFLCTFPRQGPYQKTSNSDSYPTFNFNSLYSGSMISSRAAKLKCILHYFKTITEKIPNGNISFHRQVFDDSDIPDWEKSTAYLRDLTAFAEGTIEDDGIGMLQVDFANKSIGGGALGYGCVQEEIRFLINPELLVSMLFTSILEENETVIITGAQRFSKYKGYGHETFQWDGPYDDKTPKDQLGRRLTTIVAMDAIKIHGNPFQQFSPNHIERELNKSLCGFFDRVSVTIPPPIATGNWGCGVFGGDKHLKSIIQLMSASQAGRDICYYSFGDQEFTNELTNMVALLHQKKANVGSLYKALWEYYNLMSHTKSNLSLFSYLDAHFS
ncbi:hypothetical protein DICPUDRAFT_46365 [Dictyostelium purpureum]|uniref:poly(ADP-ribose) glycohydrolase n=1 Tax=Dictyostelium purpureum TaxID=5786 RepID=F0ZEG6_DICPU|nr:uncharacterized protein DICPUDRAFT_46365 [Dictyostelium purpureum]EGC37690.1 hypothetical protein DICPUDRAFT_46365 [Dictyostelium purpureum]|eukprot:XP_003285794.1 hypothetical protein DICPUDRAFT_46365 [Dictyostelium purpureum]